MPPQCDVGAASFIREIVTSAPINLVESEVPFAVCLLLCRQRPLSLAGDLQMRQRNLWLTSYLGDAGLEIKEVLCTLDTMTN